MALGLLRGAWEETSRSVPPWLAEDNAGATALLVVAAVVLCGLKSILLFLNLMAAVR